MAAPIVTLPVTVETLTVRPIAAAPEITTEPLTVEGVEVALACALAVPEITTTAGAIVETETAVTASTVTAGTLTAPITLAGTGRDPACAVPEIETVPVTEVTETIFEVEAVPEIVTVPEIVIGCGWLLGVPEMTTTEGATVATVSATPVLAAPVMTTAGGRTVAGRDFEPAPAK